MALTTEYDPIFRRYAGRVPVAYMRALAFRESGMRPTAMASTSPNAARGLMQVVGVARQEFNTRNGTAYTADDLLNPAINIRIGAWLLNRIIDGYARHPSRNLQMNWGNPEFIKLLTAGWNAGYSDGGGVGKVASYLEARNIPVTHDSVYANASAAGAAATLSMPERATWHRSVSDLYFAQPDAGSGGAWKLLAFVALAWGAYKLSS